MFQFIPKIVEVVVTNKQLAIGIYSLYVVSKMYKIRCETRKQISKNELETRQWNKYPEAMLQKHIEKDLAIHKMWTDSINNFTNKILNKQNKFNHEQEVFNKKTALLFNDIADEMSSRDRHMGNLENIKNQNN